MKKDIGITVPYKIIAFFGSDPLYGNGKNEVRYYCPKCIERHGSPDTKGKLYVNTETLKFNCFRCGYKGQIKDIIVDESKAYKESQEIETEEIIRRISQIVKPSKVFPLKIPINKVTENNQATQYLLNRGFTYKQMEYYDLRVGNIDYEFGRIIIPNRVENLVYTDFYSARTFLGQEPKYHNPGKEKSKIVFNLHRVKNNSPIIIVEGALTAIRAGYHAVATLGKTISEDQASQIMQKHPSVIYLNYDYGAEDFALQACETLYKINPYVPIYNVVMPDERDAADMTPTEYSKILEQATLYNPLTQLLQNLH